MGFLNDLLDRGGNLGGVFRPVGRGVFNKGLKPIGRAGRSTFNTYESRVREPFAFSVKKMVEDPSGYIRGDYRSTTNAAFRGRNDAQNLIRRDLDSAPGLLPLGLEFIDPLLFAGAGSTLTKLPKAAVLGTKSAGKLGAIKGISGLLVREAAYGTMVPQLSRAAINTARLPWTLAKSRRLSGANRILKSWELARAANIDALENLTQAQKEKFLRVEMLLARGATDPEIAKDPKKLGAIFKAMDKRFQRFTGQRFAAMDIRGQVKRNSVTALAGEVVSMNKEMAQVFLHLIPEATAFERITQRIPGIRRIGSFLDPSVLSKVGDDPVTMAANALVIQRGQGLHLIENQTTLRGLMLATEQAKRGLKIDPVTTLVAGVKAKKGVNLKPTRDNVLRWGDKFFDLTDDQLDSIRAFQGSIREVGRDIKAWYLEAERAGDFTITADFRRWLNKLDTPDPRGGAFIPRAPRFTAPEGTTVAEWAETVGDRSRFLWKNEDGLFTPRIPILGRFFTRPARGLAKVKKPSRALGARQPQEFARLEDESENVIYATNLGEIYTYYARGLLQAATDDLIYGPAAKRLGLPVSKIVSGEVGAHAVQAVKARNRLSKLRDLARTIHKAGGARNTTLSGIRKSRESGAFTDDVTRLIVDLEDAVNEYVSATGELPRAVIRSGKQTSKTLLKIEKEGVEGLGKAPRPSGKRVPDTAPPGEPFDAGARRSTGGIAQRPAGSGIVGGDLPVPSPRRLTVSDSVDRTLEKGAAASFAAGESSASKKRLQAVSKRVADALTPIVNQARVDANEAKAVVRLTKKNLPMSTTRKAVRSVPGLQGRLFDEKLATLFDREFGSGLSKLEGAGVLLTGVNAIIQSFQAGLDASFIMIQSLALAPGNPAGFAKAAALGIGEMFGMDNYAKYMKGLANQMDPVSGKSWLRLLQEGQLSMSSTELFAPGEALITLRAMDTGMGNLLQGIGDLPWNRGWSAGRNIASIEMFKAQVGLEQAILGRILTNDELKSVGREVDLATGAVSSARLGVRTGQATTERILGRFGAQWMRSQTGRLVQAVNAGMDGRVARRILFQQVGSMLIAYAAASYALGQSPNFDPRDRGRFLTLSINNQRMGFSTPFRGIAQAMAEAFTGNPNQFLTVSGGRNPLFKFWKNGSPVIGRLIADTALRIHNEDEQFTIFDEGYKFFLPFFAKDVIEAPGGLEGKGVTALVGVGGSTVFPESAYIVFNRMADERARKSGFRDWDEVPAATKKDMLEADAELKQADDASKKYNERFDDPDDNAFKTVRNGRLAIEDILTPLWSRVQSGEMSRADWRAEFSDLTAKQAWLSKSVLAGVDEAKRNKNEPIQDQLARQFQAIQPELFDSDQDGIITELEWDAWREARRQFYEVYPEALDHKEYIEVAYPARVYENPLLRQAVEEKRQAQSAYDHFLTIPKYKGLSVEEGRFIDDVIGLASRASRELRFAAAERGQDISIPRKVAWQFAIQQIRGSGRQITQRELKLLTLAIRMDTTRGGRRALLSPQRTRFLMDNPFLYDWYPSSLRDAGLNDQDIAVLGLAEQPQGDPISTRVGVASARLTTPEIGVSLGV